MLAETSEIGKWIWQEERMAIVPTISNQKIGHMQTYSEGNETNYTKPGLPRWSPASWYSRINLCLLPAPGGCRKENPGHVAGLVLKGLSSRTRVGLQPLHNQWHHPNRQGTHAGGSLFEKQGLGCLPSEYMKLLLIHLSSHLRERRCSNKHLDIYASTIWLWGYQARKTPSGNRYAFFIEETVSK